MVIPTRTLHVDKPIPWIVIVIINLSNGIVVMIGADSLRIIISKLHLFNIVTSLTSEINIFLLVNVLDISLR